MLSSLVPDPWKELLQDYNSQLDELGTKLQKQADQGERILPDKKHLFRALELKPEQVKVIIVGQDPYQMRLASPLRFRLERLDYQDRF
jgi:uracil-DNA glycosylase